jgi:hypothetical protein
VPGPQGPAGPPGALATDRIAEKVCDDSGGWESANNQVYCVVSCAPGETSSGALSRTEFRSGEARAKFVDALFIPDTDPPMPDNLWHHYISDNTLGSLPPDSTRSLQYSSVYVAIDCGPDS